MTCLEQLASPDPKKVRKSYNRNGVTTVRKINILYFVYCCYAVTIVRFPAAFGSGGTSCSEQVKPGPPGPLTAATAVHPVHNSRRGFNPRRRHAPTLICKHILKRVRDGVFVGRLFGISVCEPIWLDWLTGAGPQSGPDGCKIAGVRIPQGASVHYESIW